ncbi:MAG: hypothetical protein VKK42_02410 [Lyngbya sp.]|nr:hypothetical protein [Lyngbya sp.]
MTKHDSWAQLHTPSNFDQIKHLFPHGVPMRDPFPMRFNSDNQTFWVTDKDRMTREQYNALSSLIADQHNVTRAEVEAEAMASGGLIILSSRIASLAVGLEGFARTIEIAKFYRENPSRQPGSFDKLQAFLNDQIERWIVGDEVPPPLPAWEEIPEEVKTPELQQMYQQVRIISMLNSGEYTLFDVLMGNAMTDILNKIDPEHQYSLYSEEE